MKFTELRLHPNSFLPFLELNPVNERHIIAFGGDGFITEPENKLSAQFVIGLTGKKRPKVCFLPTASGDAEGYTHAFHVRYSEDLAESSHLFLFRREVKDLRDFLLGQDV